MSAGKHQMIHILCEIYYCIKLYSAIFSMLHQATRSRTREEVELVEAGNASAESVEGGQQQWIDSKRAQHTLTTGKMLNLTNYQLQRP